MLPSFSIVIPTKDRPALLRRAIDSIERQTYPQWEIIVVDDGSSPRMDSLLLTEFSSLKIAYIWQVNSGPGKARQSGAARASGDYVCFLDDDDYYLPNHLLVLSQGIRDEKAGAEVYATGILRKLVTGEIIQEPLLSSGMVLKSYWSFPHSLLPFAISKRAIATCPIVSIPSPMEDFEWLCKILAQYSLRQISDFTVVYVDHENNRTVVLKDRASLYEREAVLDRLYRETFIKAVIGRHDYLRVLTHQRLHWTRQAIRAKQWKDAVFGFLRGLSSARQANAKEIIYTLYVACKNL